MAIKRLNPRVKLEDVAKTAGLSHVTLYDINKNPERKNIKFQTLEAIYSATEKHCGVGLVPSDYLIGVKLPFKKEITN